MISYALAEIISVLQSLALLIHICVILNKQIWQLLTPKMAISELSGNTVKIELTYLPKLFDIWHFSLQNRPNWQQIQLFTSILFNLTQRLSHLMILQAWSFIKRFTTASTKFSKNRSCPQIICFENAELAPIARSKMSRAQFQKFF